MHCHFVYFYNHKTNLNYRVMIAFTFVRKSASFLRCYLPKKIIFITYFKFENFSCLNNYFFFNCLITYSQNV